MHQDSVRIFVSSPADVEHERAIVKDVIERLSQDFLPYFRIEPVLWEQEALTADRTFQAGLVRPADCHIVLVVLWTRLGFPLPEEPYAGMTGTEWEFFDAVEGPASGERPEVLVYKKTNPKLVDITNPQATLEAIDERKRLEEFFQHNFFNPDGSFKRAFRTFDSDAAFRNLVEVQLRKLLNRRVFVEKRGSGARDWMGSPFRADRPYEFADERVFTGRESETRDLIGRLEALGEAGRGFLLVSGPSGCGKSSLIRAGLLPRLMRPYQIAGVAGCRWCLTAPGAEPGDPLRALAEALCAKEVLGDLLSAIGVDAGLLHRTLADEPDLAAAQITASLNGLAGALRAEGGEEGPAVRLALVVDPLEGLLSDDMPPPQRERYCKALTALAASGSAWVVAVLGSEYLGDVPLLGDLGRLAVGPGWMALDAPPAVRIRQIVEIPGLVAGIQYESEGTHGVVEALETEANRLHLWPPLLEGTLDALYRDSLESRDGEMAEKRADRPRPGYLTLRALKAAGGLAGEAVRRAERVWEQLDAAAREALPMLCRAVITLEKGSGPSARVADLTTLESVPDCRRLAHALIQARLLVSDAVPDPNLQLACPQLDLTFRGLLARALRVTAAKRLLRASGRQGGALQRVEADDSGDSGPEAPVETDWGSYFPTIALTHPVLLERWGPVRDWLARDQNRDALRRRYQITRQARLWKRTDCNLDYLLSDSAYAVAAEFASNYPAELEPLEEEFLARSKDYLRLQRRRHSLVRVTGVTLAGLLLLASGTAFWAWGASRTATVHLHRSLLNEANLAIARGNTPMAVAVGLDAGPYLPLAALDVLSRAFTTNRLVAMAQPPVVEGQLHVPPAFRDDGERLATFAPGHGGTLWRLEAGRFVPEQVIAGPQLDVRALVFAGRGPESAVFAIGPPGVWRLPVPVEGTPAATYACAGLAGPSAVAVDAAGRYLAFARETAPRRVGVCILDLDNPDAPPLDVPMEDGEIRSLAFSPDGDRLLTASREGRARLLDTRDGQMLLALPQEGPLRRPFNRAVFDGEGERIAIAAADERVRVYDVDGELLRELSQTRSADRVVDVHKTAVRDVAFGPQGRYLVAVDDAGQVVRWDLSEDASATVIGQHELSVEHAVLQPPARPGESALVLTASLDKTARLWDFDSGKQLAVFSHDAAVSDARFSADGSRVLTRSDLDGSARLWSVAPLSRVMHTLPHDDHVWHLDMIPAPDDGGEGRDILWLATGSFSGSVKVWSYDRGSPDAVPELLWDLPGHEDKVRRVGFSPSGRLLASAAYDGTVRVWDLMTGSTACVLTLGGWDTQVEAYHALFGADEDWLLTSSNDGSAPLRLWDLRSCSASPVALAAGNARIHAVASAPAGNGKTLIAAGSDAGVLRLFSLAPGRKVDTRCEVELGIGPVLDLAFAPNGSWIAAAGENGEGALIGLSAEGCAAPVALRGHAGNLYSVGFAPDSERLVTASLDGTARIWSLSGASLATLRGHKDRIYHAEFSPDGRWVLTASRDGVLRLWEAPREESGDLSSYLVLDGELGGVAFAGFSPDGHEVAAAYWENAAALWRLWAEGDASSALEAAWGPVRSRLAIVREADRFRRENQLGEASREP